MLDDCGFDHYWQDGETHEQRPDQCILPRVKDEPQCEETSQEVENDLKEVVLGEAWRHTRSRNHQNELQKAQADYRVTYA